MTAGAAIPVTDLSGKVLDLRAALRSEGVIPPADSRSREGQMPASGATLLVFWGTWCQPCMHEAPEIRELGRFYAKRGLRVLSVALSWKDDTPEKVAQTARAAGIDYPVLFDARDAARTAFGIEALPSTFLIDGKGIVRWKGTLLPDDINDRIKAALGPGQQSGSR